MVERPPETNSRRHPCVNCSTRWRAKARRPRPLRRRTIPGMTCSCLEAAMPRIRRDLPKHVYPIRDRYGNERYYFRRRHHKNVPMPGLPWSAEMMAAHAAVLANAGPIKIGESRTIPGSIHAASANIYCHRPSSPIVATARTRRRPPHKRCAGYSTAFATASVQMASASATGRSSTCNKGTSRQFSTTCGRCRRRRATS